MHRHFVIILVLLPVVAFPTVLFESNFECGQTYTATALKPGQRTVELCPTAELDQWPKTGGKGIVEYNLPEASEMFNYREREGRILKGVLGLTKPHGQWVDIRAVNYREWGAEKTVADADAPDRIFLDSENPMEGSHSVAFDCDTIARAQLIQMLPEIKTDILYCRFLVRFSQALLGQESYSMPVFFLNLTNLTGPRITPLKAGKGHPTFLTFTTAPGGTLQDMRTDVHTPKLEADSVYCVETSCTKLARSRMACSLWVNGILSITAISRHPPFQTTSPLSITLGKTSTNRLKGNMWIDRISVSEQRLGALPIKPILSYQDGQFQVPDPVLRNVNLKHVASQWQVSPGNSWLTPLVNTGRVVKQLTSLPHPHVLSLSDSLNGLFVFRRPYWVPNAVTPGQKCLGRVRHCADNGNWSEWSAPIPFAAPDTLPDFEKNVPSIQSVKITFPDAQKELQTIRTDTWYDMHLGFAPANRDPKYRGAFIDVVLSGDPENATGNYANRGGVFQPKGNYFFSFSLTGNRPFIRENEGELVHSVLYGSKGLYGDASHGKYRQDLEKGTAHLRFRLLPEAAHGTWTISAYFKETGRALSPTYQKVFFVSEKDEFLDQSRLAWLPFAAGFVLLAGLGTVIALRKRKSSSDNSNEDEDISLEFDSPYDEHIKTAQDYILANFTKPISPKDVAVAINVSPNWLSKLFKRGTGKNVIDYMVELRVNEAKRLLRETKMDVSEVAFNSGFNSLANFRRSFRLSEGMSPLAYRKTATA